MKTLRTLITTLTAGALLFAAASLLDRRVGSTHPEYLQWQQHLEAQGYSGAMPNVRKTAATGLGLTYSAGSVASGGAVQAITAGTLTASDTQTSCAAPAYTSCNFVYWTSSTALLTTTTAATAFAPGNVVVAFVTSTGGNITLVTPASWGPWTTAVNNTPGGASNTAGAYWIPPGNCYYTTSGGTFAAQSGVGVTGNTGLGLVASGATAGFVPVLQVATTNSGTATNTISCLINPPSTLGITGRGVNLVSATVFYGVQQTGLGTQVAVLGSGTMNGTIVFSKVAFPAAGAGETPSTGAPIRADAGTLVITPVVASSNVATTTAGSFYSVLFAPAATFALTTDLTQYYVNLTLLATATSATTINVPGVLVKYTS